MIVSSVLTGFILRKLLFFLLLLDHINKDIFLFVMLSHGKLDLSFFFHGMAEKCVDLLHISVVEIAEENNLPRVLEK